MSLKLIVIKSPTRRKEKLESSTAFVVEAPADGGVFVDGKCWPELELEVELVWQPARSDSVQRSRLQMEDRMIRFKVINVMLVAATV